MLFPPLLCGGFVAGPAVTMKTISRPTLAMEEL
jgi:hypothetical protein